MLTYVGKGYTPAFIANYDAVISRLLAGDDILIVEGPDDICAPLLVAEDAHCLQESVAARDLAAAHDVAVTIGLAVEPGSRHQPSAHTLSRLRTAFAAGAVRRACEGCEWSKLCDDVASDGYRGARL